MVSYSKNLKIGTCNKCLCEAASHLIGEGYVKVLNNFLFINSMNMSPVSDTP